MGSHLCVLDVISFTQSTLEETAGTHDEARVKEEQVPPDRVPKYTSHRAGHHSLLARP